MKNKQFTAFMVALMIAASSFSPIPAFAADFQQTVVEEKLSLADKVEQLIAEIDPTDDSSIAKNGYAEKEGKLTAGDLIITKINSKIVYYAYTEGDNALRIEAKGKTISCKYVVNATTKYYGYQKKKPTIPSGLSAEYGDSLSSLELPQYYQWKDDSIKLDKIGSFEFDVTYNPQNDLMYEQDLKVTVDVKKKKKIIPQPQEIYTLPYSSKITSADIHLPEGWSFKEEVENLVSGEYKIIYTPEDEEHYDYDWQAKEKTIKIDITRAVPPYFTPAPLTVTYGDAISSYLLPTYDNGYFSFDDAGSFAKSGYYSCHFTPYDLTHYKTVEGIMVYVTVLPKKQEEPPKKEDTNPVKPEPVKPADSSSTSKPTSPVKKTESEKKTVASTMTFNKTVSNAQTGNYMDIKQKVDTRIHFNRNNNSAEIKNKTQDDIQVMDTQEIQVPDASEQKETKTRPSKNDTDTKTTQEKTRSSEKKEKSTKESKQKTPVVEEKSSKFSLYGIAAVIFLAAGIALIFLKKKSK